MFYNLYRCCEVKTSKISNSGEIKSLKSIEKFKKIKAQLEKLKDIGANQIFLIWTFVLEYGYNRINKNLPKEIYVDDKIKIEPDSRRRFRI